MEISQPKNLWHGDQIAYSRKQMRKKSINFVRGEKTRTRAKSLDRELRWVHSLSSVDFHCGQHQSYCPFQWSMYKNQIPSEDIFFSNQLAASSIVAHRTKRKCSGFFFLWISVRSISLMNYAFLWNRKTLLWYKKQIKWNEW